MGKRQPIAKSTRFEVFKRDSFTCQYCGRSAPDVLLEVDHINPVSSGGDNNVMNLITSCWDCNRGKGAKTLDDSDIVEMLKQQISKINERRARLEVMIQWRQELAGLKNRGAQALYELFDRLTTSCAERFKAKENWVFGLWLEEYSFNEVADAIEDCVGVFCKYCGNPALCNEKGVEYPYKCFAHGGAVGYSCWKRRTEAAIS